MFASRADGIGDWGAGTRTPIASSKGWRLSQLADPPKGAAQDTSAQRDELERLPAPQLSFVLAQPLHAQRAAAVADQRLELLQLRDGVEGLGAFVVGTGDECSEHGLKIGRRPGRLARSVSCRGRRRRPPSGTG